jgi:hypothetical protein
MWIIGAMRSIICLLGLASLGLPVLGAQADIPRLQPHPPIELDERAPPDEAWETLDERPRCSFAPTDRAFERHRVPDIAEETDSWQAAAWRGERVHAQVLVWSRTPVSQLRADPVPLVDSEGRLIPAGAMRIRFVRYVLSELPLGSRKADCGEIDTQTAYLVPDVLDPAARFDVPGSTTRPVWITIDVPRDTAPGAYSGTITLRAEGGFDRALTLRLEVQGGTVPVPSDWAFRVDFWQNPWAVAHQHRVEPWSEAHQAVLRGHLRSLADMGQTYISAYITHSPWKDETYVPDGTMVEWIRQPDGSFTFDYRIFDTYVELAMSSGITDAISCFTLLPWGGRVRYLDGASGDYVWETWATDSPEYARFWKVLLPDLRRHLMERGWFEKTYLEVNERTLEDTLLAIQIVRSDSPDWKLTYAGNYHPELSEPVDDLCTIVSSETPVPEIEARRKRGQTSTFYTCCTPPFPNNFPFSPPAENVWMGWHAAAMGMDGFLRWAWDNWPADPNLDSRHVRFPAGDTFLVYPGPVASIRMELLREGFVDFEKIRVVKGVLADDNRPEAQEAMARLEKAMEAFTWDRVKTTGGDWVAQEVLAARQALAAASRVAFSGR